MAVPSVENVMASIFQEYVPSHVNTMDKMRKNIMKNILVKPKIKSCFHINIIVVTKIQ